MESIGWEDFARVELRVGTVVEAREFPEARQPAYILLVDFGPEIGPKKSSARICTHYRREELVGMQVIGVVNLPPRQIGPHRSECLITGFADEQGGVVLAVPERPVPAGSRLF